MVEITRILFMRQCGSKYHQGDRSVDDSGFAPSQLKKKTGGICRNCVRLQTADWRKTNKEASKAIYSKFYQENKDQLVEAGRKNQHKNNEYSKAYRQNNKEQRRITGIKWRAKNKVLTCFLANARRARKLQATPKWAEAELKQIEALYREAARLQEETGVIHHVDHIIPLQSDLVCGLHCLANLQILTQRENNQKSNKFDPLTFLA